MKPTYWTEGRKEQLKAMIKERKTLAEIVGAFPDKTAMAIIFEVRRISCLGDLPCRDEEAMHRRYDSRLAKREVYVEANRRWEPNDNIRLKRLFQERLNIYDICARLGRTEPALYHQMEKLYASPKERETLFNEIAFYVRMRPVSHD